MTIDDKTCERCEFCELAEANPRSGAYTAWCSGCKARALAHGPMYFESAQANVLTPSYRDALRSTFRDQWREGHEAVKAWAVKLAKGV